MVEQRPLQGAGEQGLGHVRPHLPAHHVFSAPILKGAQIRSVAIGQGQIREVARPNPVGLGRARLVQEQIRGAPPAVSRIGGARGGSLGLQGPPPVPARARAQGLAAHPVAFIS